MTDTPEEELALAQAICVGLEGEGHQCKQCRESCYSTDDAGEPVWTDKGDGCLGEGYAFLARHLIASGWTRIPEGYAIAPISLLREAIEKGVAFAEVYRGVRLVNCELPTPPTPKGEGA